ncbi:casein kinase 2 regulatory subunit [Ascosphaera pollenicola]|nr:casein kinase 2 regulatory subunit [Ascosphaera pollenicola]
MSGSEEIPDTWIASYCSLMGHEFFAEVSEDFIEDDFNLTGLQNQVPLFKEALELILDVEPDEDEDDEDDEDEDEDDGRPEDYRPRRNHRVASDMSLVETSAELLYGLIHQRYITSRAGLQQMLDKYELAHFGLCPRVHCNGCRVLPVGLSDVPGLSHVYTPPNSRFQSVDGSYFGTTFCYLFFMTFPELDVGAPYNESPMPPQQQLSKGILSNSRSQQSQQQQRDNLVINGVLAKNIAPGLGQKKIYEPKIYGFKVSERSEVGPRMKWLRMKPADITELDEERKHAEGRGDRDANEDVDMVLAAASPISERRKKAPVSRRSQMSSQSGTQELG